MGVGVSFEKYQKIERKGTPTSVFFECTKITEYNIGVHETREVRFKVGGKNDDEKRNIKFQLSNANISLSTSSWKAENEWILRTKITGKKSGTTVIKVKVEDKTLNSITIHCIEYKDVFSEEEILNIKKFLIGNAEKHGKQGHMDCITTVNHTLKLLFKNDKLAVGSQMTGKDLQGRSGTMEKLSDAGKVIKQFTIEYVDNAGRVCKKGTPYKAEQMQTKLSDKINTLVSQTIGIHVFGIAIMDGYHSMLLTVDNQNPCKRKFILSDQNPMNSDYNYTNGWKEFDNGSDLDNWITHKTKSWHSKKDSYAGTKVWKLQK
jgi:hypothetical protein